MKEDKKDLIKTSGIILGIFITLYFLKNFVINPLIADYHFNKGLKLEEEKRYSDALKELTIARDSEPTEANYQQHMGEIYYNLAAIDPDLKKKDEYLGNSINEYEKYIKMMPEDAMGYAGLGATFILAGRYLNNTYYRKASMILEKAVKINPNNIDVYNNLGAAYYLNNLFEDAIKTFEKGITIYPNEPDFYFNLGMIYFYKKNYEKANEYYEKTLKINPNHLDAKIGLSNLKEILKYKQGLQ